MIIPHNHMNLRTVQNIKRSPHNCVLFSVTVVDPLYSKIVYTRQDSVDALEQTKGVPFIYISIYASFLFPYLYIYLFSFQMDVCLHFARRAIEGQDQFDGFKHSMDEVR